MLNSVQKLKMTLFSKKKICLFFKARAKIKIKMIKFGNKLSVHLESTYFAETENFLLKVL